MLLFKFFRLIANLAFVSGDCDVGTLKLKHFDWTKVGSNVLTCFMLQTAVKFLCVLIFHFFFPLPKSQYALSQSLHSSN